MREQSESQRLLDNLKAAGCSAKMIAQFLQLGDIGAREAQLRLLAVQRRQLLALLHSEQRRIDCLDYLVFQLEQRCTAESDAPDGADRRNSI